MPLRSYQLAPLTMSGAARLGALDDDRNLRITSAHGVLGVPVPEFGHAQLDATDCTDLAPTEYRADAVVVFSGDRGRC